MNFFRQIKDSVVDFKFYNKIKDNTFGKSFVYFLVLFLIVYSISGIKIFLEVKSGVEAFASQLGSNVPDFKLENGEFSFEGPMPYYISSSTDEIFIIDTTGATNESVLENSENGILITKNSAYFKNGIETRTINFSELKGIAFTKQDVVNLVPKISWFVLIFGIFAFLFVFAYKLINALLLALAGIIVNAAYKTDLKFGNLFNLSIYALTLPILLKLAVDLSKVRIPFFGLIYWAVSIIYIIFAVKEYRDSKKNIEEVDTNVI